MQYLFLNLRTTYIFARDLDCSKNHGIKSKNWTYYSNFDSYSSKKVSGQSSCFHLINPFTIFRQDSIQNIFYKGTLRHSN